MQKPLGKNSIVLLGIGHTNAHVLKMWRMQPLPGCELICVSDFPIATYSGMLPGVLAAQYSPEAMEIDLVRLCEAVGVRLVLGKVTGIDHSQNRLQFNDRPDLKFDFLSIGVGSRPSFGGVEIKSDQALLAVKPMQTFLDRFANRVENIQAANSGDLKICVVGGGLGSIEIAFCLKHRLGTDPKWIEGVDTENSKVTLLTGSDRIGSGLLPTTVAKVENELSQRKVDVQTGRRVVSIRSDGLEFKDGSSLDADIIIWATNAIAPPLLEKLGLDVEERGFIRTHPTLQSVSHSNVFAVGDSGTIEGTSLAKAGVYAVRQGPILWDNIRRFIWNRPLHVYRPQKSFMKLINTGDDHAIAEYKGRAFYGKWWWKLKNRIDVKFMKMYQDYKPMVMKGSLDEDEAPMRCLGCGGKIGSQILSAVLSELDVPDHPDVIIGLDHPDDASVVKAHDNRVTVTTDFFASPVRDPYLTGRIALLNSASDCFVMGAQPTAALAMVQLPLGHPKAQTQVMHELMAGSLYELRKMGATLVGGHSIEGPRTTLGFTVLARQLTDPKTKGLLKNGDKLILTKALGTGVLLAALMQSKLDGRLYQPMVERMVQSNQIALELLDKFAISSLTDVTGFGFAGHLIEMLQASHASATLDVAKIPYLDGVLDLVNSGIESTLAPDNRAIANRIEVEGHEFDDPRVSVLFDPQTCGGILLGAAEKDVDSILKFLNDHGFDQSAVVGEVNNSGGDPRLTIVSRQ